MLPLRRVEYARAIINFMANKLIQAYNLELFHHCMFHQVKQISKFSMRSAEGSYRDVAFNIMRPLHSCYESLIIFFYLSLLVTSIC